MALTYNEQLSELLMAQIEERMLVIAQELASGGAEDYAAYQRRVGECFGLRKAIDLCADVQKTLAER